MNYIIVREPDWGQLNAERTCLRARVAELEQALRTYGDHHDARRGAVCRAKPGMPGDGKCTCGLDAALAGKDGAG